MYFKDRTGYRHGGDVHRPAYPATARFLSQRPEEGRDFHQGVASEVVAGSELQRQFNDKI